MERKGERKMTGRINRCSHVTNRHRVSKYRVDDDWIDCEIVYLKKRMKFDDSDAVLTTETSVPILFALLEEIKEYRAMIKEIARRNLEEKAQVPKNEFGEPERVSDEWLLWAIGYKRHPIWILACLQELQERREAERKKTARRKEEGNEGICMEQVEVE